MATFPTIAVEIDVPPDWCAQILDEHNAVLLHPRGEAPTADPANYSRAFVVSRTATNASFGVFVRRLMRRRVPQGYPRVLPPVLIGGRRALGLDYTDGVRGIASWFVSVEPGYVHEASIAAYMSPQGTTEHLAIGSTLIQCVRWTP